MATNIEKGRVYKSRITGRVYLCTQNQTDEQKNANWFSGVIIEVGKSEGWDIPSWDIGELSDNWNADVVDEINDPITIQIAPKPLPEPVELTMDEIAAKLGIDVRLLKIKK